MPDLFWRYLIAFLCGSLPTAYLAGRYFGKIDIREHGSGNVGATNVIRVMGKGIGLSVFTVDFLKGFLPAYFLSPSHNAVLWVGLAAILGHVFSPFLSFKGGKGIATGAGAVLACGPLYFIWVIAVWLLLFWLSKIVSISSIIAVGLLTILALFFKAPGSDIAAFIVYFLFTLWTHRSNISRLAQGKELKFNRQKM